MSQKDAARKDKSHILNGLNPQYRKICESGDKQTQAFVEQYPGVLKRLDEDKQSYKNRMVSMIKRGLDGLDKKLDMKEAVRDRTPKRKVEQKPPPVSIEGTNLDPKYSASKIEQEMEIYNARYVKESH